MWVSLYTYENYCHDCIWPIWSGAFTVVLLVSAVSWMIYAFRKADGKKTSLEIDNFYFEKKLFEKPIEIEFKVIYCVFVASVIVIAIFKSIYQLVDDSFPDDYIRLTNQIEAEGRHCSSGIISGYGYPSNQGQPYSSVHFSDGSEFRVKSTDANDFCYRAGKFISALAYLVSDHFPLDVAKDEEIGNLELRICWTRNVNQNLPDEELYTYSAICIYQMDGRLVEKSNLKAEKEY